MAFICSRISCYEVLFILVLVLFTHVSYQVDFRTREIGSSYNFTCPGKKNKNDTYKFYKTSFTGQKVLIKPGENVQQFGNILANSKLGWDDAGQYYCAAYDSNGNEVLKLHLFAILAIRPVKKYFFKMLPEIQTSTVDEGTSFKFHCEYEIKSTEIKWERRLYYINGTSKTDYLPRNAITVLPDTTKSVEEYIIKKVTPKDIGTYRCQVTERGVTRFTHAKVLQVKRKQPPIFDQTKPVFVGKENEDISIQFTVEGTPSPNITCYLHKRLAIFCSGKTIEATDISIKSQLSAVACSNDHYELTGYHKLIIKSASFSRNDGFYKCVARNDVGNVSIQFRVNVTVAPKISTANREIHLGRENEEGYVKCIIKKSNPRPKVTWYQQDYPDINEEPKEDEWTISQNQPDVVPQQRRGMYESTLIISKNKGRSFYRCFVENSYGNDSRIFKFLRYGIGQEPFIVVPKSKVLNEGEVFTAMCRVIKWIKGNIVFYKVDTQTEMMNDNRTNITITQGSNYRNMTMVIRNLTANDTGTYRCREKDFLTNDGIDVILTVKVFQPPVILKLQNQTVLQNKREDSEVVLFCDVKGYPFPKITWIKNGKETVAKAMLTQSCSTQVRGYYYKNKEKTKLVICKPNMKHTGFYTCSIKNHLGSDSRNVYLDVTAKPDIIKPKGPVKKRLFAGKDFKINCEAEGNPIPRVQWILKNKNRIMTNVSQGSSILEVKKMSESYIGNYTCRATNSHGIVEKSLVELELKPPEVVPTPAPAESEITTGTIIGIVVGIVILLLLVIAFVIFWYRRQRIKLLFYKHQYFLRTGDYSVDPSLTLNEQSMNLPYDPDWEFPHERLVFGERLGAGAFGEVFKAEAMGILALNPRDKSGVASKRRSKIRRTLRASQRPKKKTIPQNLSNAVVAVKTVKAQATESEIRDLAAELKLMIHIGEHKNIVNLLGACTTGRKLYVILEFCPHGNLLTFFRSKRDIYNSTWVKEIYDPEKEFTLIDIVGAAFQVAKGMEFLASRKLIHRDLAARNILVADEYVMKISDFGLARDIYQSDVYVKTSSGMLPVKWMAVESLFDRVYTHQSDVWSFGVLLWEMMTLGGTPYPNLPAEQLLDFLNEGKRMPQPNKCPLEVYTIMRDCWQEQPEERPTFSTLVEHLGRILERHLEKANPYLLVEASPEEIEAAKEKDELLKPKSDYYLQPLLMSNKLHSYDSNAPLPTPPTNAYSGAVSAPLPEGDNKPATSKIMNRAGSYEVLRDDSTVEQKAPVETENGVKLEGLDSRNNKTDVHEDPKKVESVV